MPKRRSKTSRKRKSTAIKLPLSVIITLIIIATLIVGIWAYFHPVEARMYVDNWIAQIQGKPIHQLQQPAQPIPSIKGSDNLAFGIPGNADCIIDREGYALGYIEYHEQPAWVIYHMTAEEAMTKAASRDDNFRPDPEIPTGSATLADYRGSGYDRGHLAPAADMAFSIKTMDESFYLSNMSPQKGASAEAAFLPFFKLKKPQKRHFLLKSNIHNGTFSHAFLKRKMGKKWAIYPFFPRKMGKKWGSF